MPASDNDNNIDTNNDNTNDDSNTTNTNTTDTATTNSNIKTNTTNINTTNLSNTKHTLSSCINIIVVTCMGHVALLQAQTHGTQQHVCRMEAGDSRPWRRRGSSNTNDTNDRSSKTTY